jgi:hypothetical protein
VEAENVDKQFRKEMRDRLGALESIMARADQKNVDLELYKRLAQFGFQEYQIDAVLNPKPRDKLPEGTLPNNAPPSPTYIKVHKKYLELETLQYFGIPWEYDSANPNYIVILQEIDGRETDILFEHTQGLRNNFGLTSQERVMNNQPIRRARLSSTMKNRPTELRTPPILGWAADLTRRNHSLAADEASIHEQTALEHPRTLEDSLTYCLGTIEANLKLGRLDAPPAVKTRFAAAYTRGKMYQEASETSFKDLKVCSGFLEAPEWNHPTEVTNTQADATFSTSRDRWLVTSMAERSRWIVQDSERLLDLFIGKNFDNKVMLKCWGAVQSMIMVSVFLSSRACEVEIWPQESKNTFHKSIDCILESLFAIPTNFLLLE